MSIWKFNINVHAVRRYYYEWNTQKTKWNPESSSNNNNHLASVIVSSLYMGTRVSDSWFFYANKSFIHSFIHISTDVMKMYIIISKI